MRALTIQPAREAIPRPQAQQARKRSNGAKAPLAPPPPKASSNRNPASRRHDLAVAVLRAVATEAASQNCELLGEQPPSPPANRILDGAGFFTTRRRYQASLDQLSNCVKERRESDDVCSAWLDYHPPGGRTRG